MNQVGLVSVHCWNLGERTGPYPIDPDAHCPGEAADWVPTAHETMVNVSGAIREMTNKFGYRCIVLRDCTTAYEFADTYEGRWMNLAAIRLIETDLGYSASSQDFIGAAMKVDTTWIGQGKNG